MDALIVGAGAVGQVYAAALARGGARVCALVKPGHVDGLRDGVTLHRLRVLGRPVTEALSFDELLTDPAEAASRRWDQVWLCVATPALAGAWVEELLPALGDATVVSLQPGIDVRDRLAPWLVAPDRLVEGVIGFLSYPAPLPGESLPPGLAYLNAPGMKTKLGGADRARVDAAVRALRAGGCPAARARDPRRGLSFGSAVLMPNVVALEAAGWSIAELRRRHVGLAARAVREAMGIVASRLGVRAPWARALIRAPLLWLGWLLAPRLAPLPLEAYLHRHFTKVLPQTRAHMRGYLEHAGGDAPALTELVRLTEDA